MQASSSVLGWKAKKATQVAQSLFQGGHITYIRCDNPVISPEGQRALKTYVKANFPKSYASTKLPDYSNKKAKLEHECIRPTDLNSVVNLPPDESKLYEMIKARFVAAGMSPATYDSVTIDISIGPHPFKAQGSTQTFDGYLKVWTFTKRADTTLPAVTEETVLQQRDLFSEKKETRPPSRYKGASLIEALDKLGIGKPSTMNSILEVLETREYIQYDKQIIVPTDLGKRLNDFLYEYFLNILDYSFTARVESEQDQVMSGKLQYRQTISDFYQYLKKEIKEASLKIGADKKDAESTTLVCPTCDDNLLVKKLNRKDNSFFYSCSGYQDKSCMATFSIGEDDQPVQNRIKREILQECPKKGCSGSLIKRMNKQTQELFYACSNWRKEDGNCRVTATEDGSIKIPKRLKKHGKCQSCKKGDMVERTSKAGTNFIACNRFPACKTTKSL